VIDKKRLVKYLGELSAKTMKEVDKATLISLGLVKI
jgi:mRNA-degrading endonuclease toxin of MazEF toxin-antitoxin module